MQPPIFSETADDSPSPGGEGRGEVELFHWLGFAIVSSSRFPPALVRAFRREPEKAAVNAKPIY